jgi:hypothetical protein
VALAIGVPREVFIRSASATVLVCKDNIGGPVPPNKDGLVGERLLLTIDTGLTYQQILTICQKQWGVKDYHKRLKQTASLEASPAQSLPTQTNPILGWVCAFIKSTQPD